jgi:hypothetical protein
MQILSIFEKHTTKLYLPDNDGTFLSSYAHTIEERLDDGNYYDAEDENLAESLTEEFRLLCEKEVFEGESEYLNAQFKSICLRMEKFLSKRRHFEYEDWDIVDTEN